MKPPGLALPALVLLAGLSLPLAAETVYVVERLEVGVHAERSVDSAILALLPSGTPLEVLDREAGFVRVSSEDGVTGWVADEYVMTAAPASVTIARLREEIDRAAGELEEAGLAMADLEGRLDDALERARSAEQSLLEADRSAARGGDPQSGAEEAPIPSATLREIAHLAEENQRLKQRIAELEAVAAMTAEQAAGEAVQVEPAAAPEPVPIAAARGDLRSLFRAWEAWQWMLLASGLLLAFGSGALAVDYRIRRRHGGFRV